MSNNKENERKILYKKRMLLQLEHEIKRLEKEIKYSNISNFKIKTIRNLKIGARALQRITPYVLTAGITAGGFKILTGNFPFYRDSIPVYSNIMTEFDNDGQIITEQQYVEFSYDSNKLYFYSKWDKQEDGSYSRKVEKYNLNDISIEYLNEIINKDDINLQELFGNPYSSIVKTNNSLTEDELNKKDYLQVIIYEEDKSDYILVKQPISENIWESFVYIICTLLAQLIPINIRINVTKFNFEECVKSIKKQYKPINVSGLIKKLEIKKDNYNRLIR